MKLAKENSHPLDEHIIFDEKPHIYYIEGESYDKSVTSFIHDFFGEFEPDKIIDKFYDMWQSNPSSKYYGLEPDEIKHMWEENGKLQSQLGTKLHQNIELFYNEEEIDYDEVEFEHFMNFHKEHMHLKPFRTEWMIYAKDLKLAGSIDMVYEEEGILHIYDWKRSKEIKEQNQYQEGKYPLSHLPDCNYWHYSLQLNCYKAILEKYYNVKVGDLYLVVLHPDNNNFIKIKAADLQKEIDMLFELRLDDLKNMELKNE